MMNTELLDEVLKRAKNYTNILVTHPNHRDQTFRVVAWCRHGNMHAWSDMPDSFKVDREVFRCSLEDDQKNSDRFFFFKDEVEVLDCPASIAVSIVLDIIAELTDRRVLQAGDDVLEVLENYDSYRDEDDENDVEDVDHSDHVGDAEEEEERRHTRLTNDFSEPCSEESGVYVHLLTVPGLPALVAPGTVTAENWKQIGLAYYGVVYNFYEPSSDEEWEEHQAWLMKWKTWLSDNIPEELRQGVHLLGAGRGFMGEDVYVADGHITHTIHVDCEKCNVASLLWRDGGVKMWCANCNDYSSPGRPW